MSPGRAVAAAVAIAASAGSCQRSPSRTATDDDAGSDRSGPTGSPRWLAVGGGSLPGDFQVSIEQDLELAAAVLPGAGAILFAGGAESTVVQVEDPVADATLSTALGDLFAPRPGRNTRYRKTRLGTARPGTADDLRAALSSALATAGPGLTVYFAGHGNPAEVAADTSLALWAQSAMTARELAELLDRTPAARPLRLVLTSCYGGGFAEVVFRGADPGQGPAATERCGLFASTWDLPADGCDPNPERRQQEGYGVYFLNALRGRDRAGKALPATAVDVDGNGRVSLLEAHTYTRIASRSANVPTTTSERWLRHAAPTTGPSTPYRLAEERAVVAALRSRALPSVDGDATDEVLLQRAGERLAAIDGSFRAVESRLKEAQSREHAAYREAAAELLARWPVLDDPWHPDHGATVASNADAIRGHLDRSTAYARYRDAVAEVQRLDADAWALRLQAAPIENLYRAVETLILAGRLHRAGGDAWQRYLALRSCESASP